MSDAYRRLMDLDALPPAKQGSTLPGDARQIAVWLETLPRASPEESIVELHAAVSSLSEREDVAGGDRLATLELLRPPALEVASIISRAFATVALPLPSAGAEAARQVESLHRRLADEFRRSAVGLCTSAGTVPILRRGKLVQALERAVFHYSQALAVAWATYRPPRAGTWQGLLRCQEFADSVSCAERKASDPSVPGGGSVRGHVVRTLLVAVAHPYAFDQDDQQRLWQVATDYAPHCGLSPAEAAIAGGGGKAAVDMRADEGPGSDAGDEGDWHVLDFQVLESDLVSALEVRAGDAGGAVVLGRGRGRVHRLSIQMARQLLRALGQRSARRVERLPGGHQLECVVGLSGLHYHLCGLEFGGFVRQAREQITEPGRPERSTEATHAPLVCARVLDHGLGGYRLEFTGRVPARIRVGELIGLSWIESNGPEDSGRDWLVGVLRWLRYGERGLNAGVELLARDAVAVAIEPVLGGDRGARVVIRAIELRNVLDGPWRDGRMDVAYLAGEDANALESVEILGGGRSGPRSGASIPRLGPPVPLGEYLLLGRLDPGAAT